MDLRTLISAFFDVVDEFIYLGVYFGVGEALRLVFIIKTAQRNRINEKTAENKRENIGNKMSEQGIKSGAPVNNASAFFIYFFENKSINYANYHADCI